MVEPSVQVGRGEGTTINERERRHSLQQLRSVVGKFSRKAVGGIQLTRLGHRARAAAPLKVVDPRGKEGYWIAAAGDAEDGGPGTDFHAVMQGFVSITPLQLDRTFNDAFEQLDGWLEGLL